MVSSTEWERRVFKLPLQVRRHEAYSGYLLGIKHGEQDIIAVDNAADQWNAHTYSIDIDIDEVAHKHEGARAWMRSRR